MKPSAAIFDLDGTLIDNNPFHFKAWQALYATLQRTLSFDEYKANINGKRMKDSLKYIFQRDLTDEETAYYFALKENKYKELYAPHIAPIKGLIAFLTTLHEAGIPIAMATSAPPSNVRFLFDHLPLEKYFSGVIDATQISKGKPDPEVFLKAAASVHASPINCIAFEDSIAGIASAKAAGMKVVALTTAQLRSDIHTADIVIDDYTEISLSQINQLFHD